MATLLQFNRIQTNRAGAVSDTVTRLESATAGDIVNIQLQNIPDLPATQITSGTLVDSRIPATVTREGTGANAVVRAGTGATAVVLEGDGTTAVVREGTAATAVVRQGSGNSGDASQVLRRGDLDSTSFTFDSGGNVVATPASVNLSNIETYTTTALRNAATDVAWHVGDVAIITGADGRGTYVYDGSTNGDNHTGVTVDADWTILVTATNVSFADITGTATVTQIPAAIARDTELFRADNMAGTATPITAVAQGTGDNNDQLMFNAADGTTLFTYDPPATTAMATIPEVYETTASLTTVAGNNNTSLATLRLPGGTGVNNVLTERRPAGVTASTRVNFPTDNRRLRVYIDGLKLSWNEVALRSAEQPTIDIIIPTNIVANLGAATVQVEII